MRTGKATLNNDQFRFTGLSTLIGFYDFIIIDEQNYIIPRYNFLFVLFPFLLSKYWRPTYLITEDSWKKAWGSGKDLSKMGPSMNVSMLIAFPICFGLPTLTVHLFPVDVSQIYGSSIKIIVILMIQFLTTIILMALFSGIMRFFGNFFLKRAGFELDKRELKYSVRGGNARRNHRVQLGWLLIVGLTIWSSIFMRTEKVIYPFDLEGLIIGVIILFGFLTIATREKNIVNWR